MSSVMRLATITSAFCLNCTRSFTILEWKNSGSFRSGSETNDYNAFGFDTLHDALDTGSTEIVRAALHDEAVDTDDFWIAFESPA